MRVVQNLQMQIGEVDISAIQIDPKSRDDIPRILRGLQYLYVNTELREAIFRLLEEKIAPGVSKDNGRPGMTLWRIVVSGTLRLDLKADFDRLGGLRAKPRFFGNYFQSSTYAFAATHMTATQLIVMVFW
jgi:IS5 family transposase